MINKNQLIELGFSNKEAGVYIALLELGPSTTTEISRRAKINRTTGYDILESLASDGLVNTLGETKIQKFVAESPEKVITFLENKIKTAEEKLKQAKVFLPELLSVYNTKDKPKVRFYEGVENIKEVFEDTLTSKEEILAYAVGRDAIESVGIDYVNSYMEKRVKNNIKIRVIAPDEPRSLAIINKNKEHLRESLTVPRDKFNFSIETDIYEQKILTVSWKEKFAVLIESKEIADAQKKVFELAWLGAKSLKI